MGKASTWIKNFLMGKKDDKNKKSVPSILPESRLLSTPAVNLPVTTPKVKRRWSFKRSNSSKATTHKSTKSFDSILIPKQGLLEYESQHTYVMPLLLHANAAATKIQAVYRSYLARRALRALRGLVKIQALARGHLVRKQMTAFMRSMHAVLAIQVRARIHRIQMAEEPVENATGQSIHQIRGHIDHILAEKVDHCSSRRNSVRLSVEHKPKMCPSPSPSSFTESSFTTYNDGQLEEFSLKMAQRNSKRFANSITQCPDYTTSNSEIKPSYMTNTESSKAKTRSHSEPRRRHKSQKARRISSMDGKNDNENQYSWLDKFYRSSNFMNDEDCDSMTLNQIPIN